MCAILDRDTGDIAKRNRLPHTLIQYNRALWPRRRIARPLADAGRWCLLWCLPKLSLQVLQNGVHRNVGKMHSDKSLRGFACECSTGGIYWLS